MPTFSDWSVMLAYKKYVCWKIVILVIIFPITNYFVSKTNFIPETPIEKVNNDINVIKSYFDFIQIS